MTLIDALKAAIAEAREAGRDVPAVVEELLLLIAAAVKA